MPNNKYIKMAEKYMDSVARHYDPVPQESAIIDFAIWLDKQAAEQSVQSDGACTCAPELHWAVLDNSNICAGCLKPRR